MLLTKSGFISAAGSPRPASSRPPADGCAACPARTQSCTRRMCAAPASMTGATSAAALGSSHDDNSYRTPCTSFRASSERREAGTSS